MTDKRDAKGQFAKGNAGGPGRPKRQTETEYLQTMAGACTLEDWGDIVQKAVADAKEGDARARKWLSSYLLGEPQGKAPTMLAVLVSELVGRDPVREAVTDAHTTSALLDDWDALNRVDQKAVEAAMSKLED